MRIIAYFCKLCKGFSQKRQFIQKASAKYQQFAQQGMGGGSNFDLSVCFYVHFLSTAKENEPKERRSRERGFEKSAKSVRNWKRYRRIFANILSPLRIPLTSVLRTDKIAFDLRREMLYAAKLIYTS